MAALEVFEVFPVRYGSGSSERTCLHVKVQRWIRPKGYEDKDGVVCLTYDACDPDEFDAHIDELIAELKQLKIEGRNKFSSLRRITSEA